jgi:dihydrofolate reductase
VKLIVSVDERWGIGRDNGLLFSIPEDMAFFKAATLGKTVVMGRATLESLPRSEPLKGRRNIVLSRDETLTVEGATTCGSIGRLGALLAARGGNGRGGGDSGGVNGSGGGNSGGVNGSGGVSSDDGNGSDDVFVIGGSSRGGNGGNGHSGGGSRGSGSDDVFVIGGHSVYSQLLAYCDEALVTKVCADGRADRFFPDLDRAAGWAVAGRSEAKLHNGLRYSFFAYRNKSAKAMPCGDAQHVLAGAAGDAAGQAS